VRSQGEQISYVFLKHPGVDSGHKSPAGGTLPDRQKTGDLKVPNRLPDNRAAHLKKPRQFSFGGQFVTHWVHTRENRLFDGSSHFLKESFSL
jgi:hypothetical protein